LLRLAAQFSKSSAGQAGRIFRAGDGENPALQFLYYRPFMDEQSDSSSFFTKFMEGTDRAFLSGETICLSITSNFSSNLSAEHQARLFTDSPR
jgi:hypothetical protein